MFPFNTYSIKLSHVLIPESIHIFNDKISLASVLLNLLERLSVKFKISNYKKAYNELSAGHKNKFIPIRIIDDVYYYQLRLSNVYDLHIAFGIVNELVDHIEFKKENNKKIIILILSPKSRPDLFLKAEKALKSFFTSNGYKETMFNLQSPKKIWELIDKTEEKLPKQVLAGDIMSTSMIVLKDNNTLKEAIDLFIETGLLNIPVIDIEGDLIGEANACELMNIALPRHLLWMSNMKPLINFEPFFNVLENENYTWLAEIITQELATVQVEDYAMKAMIEMTKKELRSAYVLDDKKLVGVITMKHFMNKVLR